MNGAIQAVGSSLATLSDHYRTITHNLANVNTTGFKRQVHVHSQSFDGQRAAAGRDSTDAAVGQVSGQMGIDFSQGRLIHTDRPLDLAIQGPNAFFVIETPEGPLYTRNGVFQLNAQGQLVDAAGNNVGSEGGPIVIPSTISLSQIVVSTNGQISAGGQAIGKLRVQVLEDLSVLEQVGSSCFRAPATAATRSAEDVRIHQGFQEGSNVSTVQELVDLITVARMYEANLKTIQARDDGMDSLLQATMS